MANMMQNEVIRLLWREIEPELLEQGYELVEVEYAGSGGGRILRVFVDKAEANREIGVPGKAEANREIGVPGKDGVTLDDCQVVSELLGPLLDKGDFVSDHYTLEVSSPGLDRPVRKPVDFVRFSGERVRLVACEPVKGRKRFNGVLRGFNKDGMVLIECDGASYEVHIENLKKAHLVRN